MDFYPQLVIDTLKTVIHPSKGKSIVDLGMLEDDIRIDGKRISFSLIFDRPNNPDIPKIKALCAEAIKANMGDDAVVEGGIYIKIQPKKAAAPVKLLPNVKNIIAIASGKGGVGKSTISANLAVALANCNYKVGLIDADIFGPSVPKMFNTESERPVLEQVDGKNMIAPVNKYGVKMLSIGYFVDPDEATVWRGAMATGALKQLISEGNWGELDYLLIDLPPGTSDIHLTLVQTLAVTGAIIVSTPQDVALADAVKGINMFTSDNINIPILGVVENMAWFTPAELPENKYYIFGKDGGQKLAERYNTELLAQIPLVQSVREAGDKGEPSALNNDSIMGIAFNDLAKKAVDAINKRNEELPETKKVDVKTK